MKKVLIFAIFTLTALVSFGQPAKQYVTPYAEPDHADWTYKCSDQASVRLFAVVENRIMEDTEIQYSYGPEKLEPVFKGSVKTDKKGYATIKVPGRKEPGFTTVRVTVEYKGKTYSNITNLAYEPFNIKPTVQLPSDFQEYWENAKKKAAEVPMLTKVVWNEKESNTQYDVYHVQVQAYRRGTHFYGVLTVPKDAKFRNAEGKMPAILRLPGANIGSFRGPSDLARHGFVVLDMGVHGIPIDKDQEVYSALSSGGLGTYTTIGIENRDSYYYKRVYMSCIRAIDFLCSREEVDADRIAVYGGSQGGMLSIVTASLDKRVAAMVCYFPAFCDVTGYYRGRSGGWPHFFTDKNEPDIEKKIKTLSYYDVVNFARFLTRPGHYCWGFNDIVCCPSSTFSAYNVITAPKELEISRDSGHWLYPVYVDNQIDWLKRQFDMK